MLRDVAIQAPFVLAAAHTSYEDGSELVEALLDQGNDPMGVESRPFKEQFELPKVSIRGQSAAQGS